jgi:hypothetical protein
VMVLFFAELGREGGGGHQTCKIKAWYACACTRFFHGKGALPEVPYPTYPVNYEWAPPIARSARQRNHLCQKVLCQRTPPPPPLRCLIDPLLEYSFPGYFPEYCTHEYLTPCSSSSSSWSVAHQYMTLHHPRCHQNRDEKSLLRCPDASR